MSNDDFFIGSSDQHPQQDRRTFLRTGLTLTAGSALTGFGLAKLQTHAGNGGWDGATENEYRGLLVSTPYPMLITNDLGENNKTALLGCQLKCGVALKIKSFADKQVVIKGSLIKRGDHAMIAVSESADWIREVSDAGPAPALTQKTSLGKVSLNGEILDSKCWFGAMRPGHGKTHKSCASLCIRGGIPPALFVNGQNNKSALMLLTENMESFSMSILPFVADPVQITGELYQHNGTLFLDSSSEQIIRV